MSRSSLVSNLVAGLASTGWTGLTAIIVVPYYIAALGVANYGLVTFFATLQGLFAVLDLGFATSTMREVARSIAQGSDAGARNLVRTLEALYWLVGTLIGVVVVLAAPFIGRYWLHSAVIDEDTVVQAVRMMGLVFVFRWPIGLYLGVMHGGQRIVAASVITMLGTTLTTFGTVAMLRIVPPTMATFFLWQTGVAFLQVLVMKHNAWRVFGTSSGGKIDLGEIRRIWGFSGLIALTMVIGAVLVQADKLLLSSYATLEDVAVYGLAWLAARSLTLIVTPIFSAVYPSMTAMVAAEKTDDLVNLHRVGTKLLSMVLWAIGAYFCFQSFAIFRAWTHSDAIARSVGWIVPAMVIGTILNGVMYFPQALQLAYGDAKLRLQINVVLIAFHLPALMILVPRYGALGAALAWLAMNVINLVFGTWLTHRSLLRGMGATWLLRDALAPGLMVAALIWAGGQLLPFAQGSTAQAIAALPLIPIAILLVSSLFVDIRSAAHRWGLYRRLSSAMAVDIDRWRR